MYGTSWDLNMGYYHLILSYFHDVNVKSLHHGVNTNDNDYRWADVTDPTFIKN